MRGVWFGFLLRFSGAKKRGKRGLKWLWAATIFPFGRARDEWWGVASRRVAVSEWVRGTKEAPFEEETTQRHKTAYQRGTNAICSIGTHTHTRQRVSEFPTHTTHKFSHTHTRTNEWINFSHHKPLTLALPYKIFNIYIFLSSSFVAKQLNICRVLSFLSSNFGRPSKEQIKNSTRTKNWFSVSRKILIFCSFCLANSFLIEGIKEK